MISLGVVLSFKSQTLESARNITQSVEMLNISSARMKQGQYGA